VKPDPERPRRRLICLTQEKTREALEIPIHRYLDAALDALPRDNLTFLMNGKKPFTSGAFRYQFGQWWRAAGLRLPLRSGRRSIDGRPISRRHPQMSPVGAAAQASPPLLTICRSPPSNLEPEIVETPATQAGVFFLPSRPRQGGPWCASRVAVAPHPACGGGALRGSVTLAISLLPAGIRAISSIEPVGGKSSAAA
jgi:hypothetical protein